jgi:chromosome segregation protein
MFLKLMDIYGFKSFADKTTIQFGPGITILIGPNGCGKSNVVDSIKWVLGEKQAKNIRGQTMEDIIFSGTESRKQLSYSEVSLSIDNSRKILDIDSDTIVVTRRVFRDGESEYLINKSTVRLKDIEKLFMDTGIGKSSYSVMEQGKMDLILSTRAEDRRYIFEEAAGISRYKMQKKESLKKLTETGENLERINDVIKEIEREKDNKAKQAERTKIYLGLRDEMIQYDMGISIIKYSEFLKRQDKLASEIARLKKDHDAISLRVSSTSTDNDRDEKRRNDIQHQLFELDKKLQGYRIRVEEIDSRTETNRVQIEEHTQRKENIQKKISERNASLNEHAGEKEKSIEAGREVRKKIEDDRARLQALFDSRKNRIESIHSSRDMIEKNKKEIISREHALKELRGALEVVIKKLVDAIEKRKAEISSSEDERQAVRARIHEKIKVYTGLLEEIRRAFASGIYSGLGETLQNIDLVSLNEDISSFESYEDGFRSILFDKTGIHAEKEEIDRRIAEETSGIDSLKKSIAELEKRIEEYQTELEGINEMITRIEKDLARNENEKEWIDRHLQSLEAQIKDLSRQIEGFNEEFARSDKAIGQLSKEINEWSQRLIEFNEKSESLVVNIRELAEKRGEIEKLIHERKNVARKDEEEIKKLADKISSLDREQVEVIFKKNNIEEYLWTEYEKKISEIDSSKIDESRLQEFSQRLSEVRKKIQDLGAINNLAIEEYRDLKKRFEYYISQKTDIEKARQDILSVIEEINSTSIEIFLSTFKDIQKNFQEVFRQLFEGGDATVELTDPENILECGIDIIVRPPGKKHKNINLLSGGERALTAIALMFGTYMVKPSPFCFLDEIDAPLDEENIGRFVRLLREFSRSTQFIVVTHNKKTMSIGEMIYGVTMEEPGVSKLVSLKMEKLEKK